MSKRSDAVIAAYLEEIERTAGPDVASTYSLWYDSGWVRMRRGGSRLVSNFRLSKIETFTDNLRRRKDY